MKEWNSRPDTMKTFSHFKTFFRDEHAALDQVDGLKLQNSSLANANLLQQMAQQQETIVNQFEERLKVNLLDVLDDFTKAEEANNNSTATSTTDQLSASLSTLTRNSDKNMTKLVQLFDGLCKKVDDLEKGNNNRSKNGDPTVNPRTGKPWRRYCWSCGCCDHWGRNCPNRKRGHKVDATFKNRMGGSTEGVLGV